MVARQRQPHRYFMCCLWTFCVFLSVTIIPVLNPCASYTILPCIMSIKYYHTIPYHICTLFDDEVPLFLMTYAGHQSVPDNLCYLMAHVWHQYLMGKGHQFSFYYVSYLMVQAGHHLLVV